MIAWIFWMASALVGYTYVGFPVLVGLRARLRRRPHLTADISPTVSVIIAAHNEAPSIEARVANLLALDYPADRLEVVIASDGSSDLTVASVRSRGCERVRVLDLPRVGKATALNRAVEASTGSILVFSDANTTFAIDAVGALVRSFADPEVGGVAGNQIYLRADGTNGPPDSGAASPIGLAERRYWDYDRIIKEAESLGGSVVSATGAIYAIRRELFRPVPDGVTDDFATSTLPVVLGHRLVFEPNAIALEPVAGSRNREYRRKVRIMTRGLRGVAMRRQLLDPRRFGFYALQLLTHKVLRRLMVLPLLVVAASTIALWDAGPIYRIAGIGQIWIYGLGAAGLALRDHPQARRPWLAIPAFFLLVNVASLHALANLLIGRRIDRWQPAREIPAAPDSSGSTPVDTVGHT